MDEEHIKFQITKIKEALEILRKIHRNLFDAMNLKSQQNPNEFGRLDRIIKEYIVIKIAALVDKDERTFSLHNINNQKVSTVLEKYKELLLVMKVKRNKAFGHHEKKFIMSEEIISTRDILDLSIVSFLDEIVKCLG